METKILKENDASLGRIRTGILDNHTSTFVKKLDFLANKLSETLRNGLQAKFLVFLPLRTTEVGAENDSLGSFIQSFLDCRDGAFDPLVISDMTLLIERNIKVDPHQNSLSCHVDVVQNLLIQVQRRSRRRGGGRR